MINFIEWLVLNSDGCSVAYLRTINQCAIPFEVCTHSKHKQMEERMKRILIEWWSKHLSFRKNGEISMLTHAILAVLRKNIFKTLFSVGYLCPLSLYFSFSFSFVFHFHQDVQVLPNDPFICFNYLISMWTLFLLDKIIFKITIDSHFQLTKNQMRCTLIVGIVIYQVSHCDRAVKKN